MAHLAPLLGGRGGFFAVENACVGEHAGGGADGGDEFAVVAGFAGDAVGFFVFPDFLYAVAADDDDGVALRGIDVFELYLGLDAFALMVILPF